MTAAIRDEKATHLSEADDIALTEYQVLSDKRKQQILLHYYLLNPLQSDKPDERHLERGDGLCLHDLRLTTTTIQVEVLRRLNILQWFDRNHQLHHHNRALREWANWVKQYRGDIRDFLGVTIHENDPPVRVLAILLGKLGIKLEKLEHRRVKGGRLRFYRFPELDDGRLEIFEAWNVQASGCRAS